MMQRLHKILRAAGFGSLRHCEDLVKAGRVTVDGKEVRRLGAKADPEKNVILCNGQRVKVEKKVYYIVNKPRGCVGSIFDEKKRRRVVDLIPRIPQRIFPIGRLDIDSEGLMILTNDGELANRIAHPRYNVTKTYLATVKGAISSATIDRLSKGVRLGERKTSPCKLAVKRKSGTSSVVEVVLKEECSKDIRRMFALFGHPIITLKRVKIGGLSLGKLPPGKYEKTDRQTLIDAVGIEEDIPVLARRANVRKVRSLRPKRKPTRRRK